MMNRKAAQDLRQQNIPVHVWALLDPPSGI
jgi:hypothetical protein